MTPKTIPTTDATETDPKNHFLFRSIHQNAPKGEQLNVRDEFSKK